MQIKDMETKKIICEALRKDGFSDEVINEYQDVIAFFESSEGKAVKRGLFSNMLISIQQMIVFSAICLGPVLWLLIDIHRGLLSKIQVEVPFALIGTALLTSQWIFYIQNQKKHKEEQKEKNRNSRWVFPLFIISVLLALALFLFVTQIQIHMLAPEGWLFYQMSPVAEVIMMICTVLFIVYILYSVVHFLKLRKGTEIDDESTPLGFGLFWKYKAFVIVVLLAGIIISICDVTFVTKDRIKDFSIFNLSGTEYSYEDVESIKANFGTKTFAILEHKKKGQFSYTVNIGDKEYIFSVPTVNEEIDRYAEHSYLELEEFDEALMQLGVRKMSDDAGSQFCDLDSEYVERFLKIINNK